MIDSAANYPPGARSRLRVARGWRNVARRGDAADRGSAQRRAKLLGGFKALCRIGREHAQENVFEPARAFRPQP